MGEQQSAKTSFEVFFLTHALLITSTGQKLWADLARHRNGRAGRRFAQRLREFRLA